jgi:protein-tyrosine phosphatase
MSQLRAAEPPRAIIVLCHGNVCRSPYLEAALRRELAARPGNATHVDSAGFVGPHRQSPELACACAADRGLDLGPHRSRLVTREMLDAADLVLVMDESQRDALSRDYPELKGRVVITGDLDPERGTRTIADPWGKPRDAFEESFRRLDRCAQALGRALQR